MRKVISILISAIIVIASISCSFTAMAEGIEKFQYQKATNNLKEFADKVYSLTQKYDSEIDDSHDSSNTTKAVKFMSAASVVDEPLLNSECFKTNRLIAYSNNNFDDYGAIEHLSGYESMHILQYDNLEDTISAYKYLLENKDIDFVEPDSIVTLEEFNESSDVIEHIDYPHDETIDVSWGYERIQTYDAFQYILNHNNINNLHEIVIGIIDDGINVGNRYFDERLIAAYSYINMNPYHSNNNHGACVAGVILENTLPNVKIISYQVFDNSGYATSSLIHIAEMQAKLDNVDIVNSSYGFPAPFDQSSNNNSTLISDESFLHIASAGNDGSSKCKYPAANKNTISVANIKDDDRLSASSNYGLWVDVAAPGNNILIPSTQNEGQTAAFYGTSCAAPFVSSVCAMIMTQYPTFSNSLIADILFNSCEESSINVRYGIVNMFKAVSYYDNDISCQTATPQFNLSERPSEETFYSETQYIELHCTDDNSTIYYTLDNTIPSNTNGNVYTGPIELSSTATICAVAYSNNRYRSKVAKRTFYIRKPLSNSPNENGWHIRENGMIWAYSGPETNLIVPESVFGITVVGIESEAFLEQSYISSITMPNSLTTIEDKAFYKCTSLKSVIAPGVTEIGNSAFYGCRVLDYSSFPSLNTIGNGSFRNTGLLEGFPFENLTTVPRMSFYGSDILKANLENTITIKDLAFANCSSLIEVRIPLIDTENDMGTYVFENCKMLNTMVFNEDATYIPQGTFKGCDFVYLDSFDNIEIIDEYAFSNNESLTTLSLESTKIISSFAFENCLSLCNVSLSNDIEYIGTNAFDNCKNLNHLELYGDFYCENGAFDNSGIERLEMNKVTILNDLPNNTNCKIALPSTFSGCTEDTQGRNYIIYGSSGTYAEQWALENGHDFIEVSQDTAIMSNIDDICTKNEELKFDCIGFNKTYQWYGTFDNSTNNGVAIEGATNELLNIEEHSEYPFYYCVCTSTDIDEENSFEHQELIYSNVCHNTDYNISDNTAIGDVDLNGIIDENDYAMLLSYVQCQSTLTDKQKAVSDFNNDTVIDAFDVIWLDLYLNGVINIDGTGVNYIKGDVNEDGAVSIEDYSTIKSYLAGTVELTGTNYYEADVNNDSAVDAFDLYYIDTYINKCYQGFIMK